MPHSAAALAWSEGLSKNFLVGLLGIGSSSENASLGLLMNPEERIKVRIKSQPRWLELKKSNAFLVVPPDAPSL
jgi:hypothetical protein